MPCATEGYLLDLSIKHKRQGDEVKISSNRSQLHETGEKVLQFAPFSQSEFTNGILQRMSGVIRGDLGA